MYLRLCVLIVGMLVMMRPAFADSGRLILTNLNISPGIDETAIEEDRCRTNPYALYRQTCVNNELNISLERADDRLTVLDQLALIVYRYKDLNLDAELRRNVKLKLMVSLANLYEQEAKARLTLRIRF